MPLLQPRSTWGRLTGLGAGTRRVAGEDGATHIGRLTVNQHRDDLQGLRAVAVLLVCLGHAGVRYFDGGYVGVDVFFVLSGFLITGLLVAGTARRGAGFLSEFYVRRARRILPAAALALVVTDLASYWLLNLVRAREVAIDSVWAGFFAANFRFAAEATDYFARAQPPSPVLNFWSLAVEEQFYLVWPALLCLVVFGISIWKRPRLELTGAALGRLFVVIVVAGLASLAWSIYRTETAPNVSYFSPFSRAWELALGAALALATPALTRVPASPRTAMGWAGLAAIAYATVDFSSRTAFPGYAALVPTVGAALMIGAGVGDRQPRFGVGRLLAVAPMRYVGDRSYALYLWHWPVLIIAFLYVGHELSVGVNLLLLLGAFALSIASYRFFENPMRHASWRGRSGLLLWPASAGIVALVAWSALHSIHERFAQLQAPAAAGATTAPSIRGADLPVLAAVAAAAYAATVSAPIPSPLTPPIEHLLKDRYVFPGGWPGGCSALDGQTKSRVCRLGRTNRRLIVAFGDSHAQMWMPTLLKMAQKDGWTVVALTKSGCTPDRWINPVPYPEPSVPSGAECRAWDRWALQQVRALHPYVFLATGAYAYSAAPGPRLTAVADTFGSLVTSVKRSAAKVVVLGDAPLRSQEPVDCLLAKDATMKTCTDTWTWQTSSGEAVAAKVKPRGARFIDTTRWFCYQTLCPLVIGRTIAYADSAHITKTYARQLSGVFAEALRKALVSRR
jgi:peptidoglycan/LPS O-acetylase OafA/YrhL